MNFAGMLKSHQHDRLRSWIQQARSIGVLELRRFADGLEQEWEAVQAALASSYSDGMVEGHINRLKTLKRQMYGRASLALPRIRVLYG
jgi:transposase